MKSAKVAWTNLVRADHRLLLMLSAGKRPFRTRHHCGHSWPISHYLSAVLVTLVRKPGLTSATFEHEWTGPHAEMALAWRNARGGNGHYVQNLVVAPDGANTRPLDGIGESEVPGSAPIPAEREARLKTAAHAATFQDMSKAATFVARETIWKD